MKQSFSKGTVKRSDILHELSMYRTDYLEQPALTEKEESRLTDKMCQYWTDHIDSCDWTDIANQTLREMGVDTTDRS
jgi:hypothetical protein